jgi:hypothetical protein
VVSGFTVAHPQCGAVRGSLSHRYPYAMLSVEMLVRSKQNAEPMDVGEGLRSGLLSSDVTSEVPELVTLLGGNG